MKDNTQTNKQQPKEKKLEFDWSKWGFWLALFLFLITVGMWAYQTYFHDNKPNLSYEILSNEEVLTLKEEVPSLQIRYNDIELKSDEKNLTILTFRVINKGRSGILSNHYDPLNPIGFYIEKGVLLKEPDIIKNSEDYLVNPIEEVKSDTVFFKNLIIDEDSYFDVKCLIMNNLGTKPKLISFGKISGIKNIGVDGIEIEKNEKNRGDVYFLLMVLFTVLISKSSSGILKKIYFRLRQSLISTK